MSFFVSLHQYGDFGLLALRLIIGAIFLVHGLQKRAMWKMQPSEQMPAKMISIMKLLSVCEPLGALAFFSGFLTQLASLGFVIIMCGAVNLKRNVMKKKFADVGGWEFDAVILGGALVIFFIGAGAFSLDRLFFGI
jgi:putative oxidoreductase